MPQVNLKQAGYIDHVNLPCAIDPINRVMSEWELAGFSHSDAEALEAVYQGFVGAGLSVNRQLIARLIIQSGGDYWKAAIKEPEPERPTVRADDELFIEVNVE